MQQSEIWRYNMLGIDIWSFFVDVFSSGVQVCILIVMVAVFLQTSRWNFKKHVTDQLTIYSSHVQQFRIDSLIKSEIRSNSNAERDLDIDNFYGRRAIAYYFVKFAGLLVQVILIRYRNLASGSRNWVIAAGMPLQQ